VLREIANFNEKLLQIRFVPEIAKEACNNLDRQYANLQAFIANEYQVVRSCMTRLKELNDKRCFELVSFWH
jgi:hypothetical protein